MSRSPAKSGKATAMKSLNEKWLSIVQSTEEKGENETGGSSIITNWRWICNPELHVLARHDWWPWVTFNFAGEQHASESTPEVFGQQAQQECAEIESSTSGSVMEDKEVVAKQKANAAGKQKATESGTEEVLELEQDASRPSGIAGVKQKKTGEGDHQQHSEVVEHGCTRT